MDLREEQVEMRGAVYTVRELSACDIIPIMEAMNDEQGDDEAEGPAPPAFSQRVFEACCTLDGETLVLETTPASVYMRLLPIAMRLNGLTAQQEGNA